VYHLIYFIERKRNVVIEYRFAFREQAAATNGSGGFEDRPGNQCPEDIT